MGSYGGQTALLASVLAGAPNDRLHLVDNGISVLLTFGLIFGYRASRPRAPFLSIILALLVLTTLPHVPHNLGSEFSGVVFFLALFRIVDDPGTRRESLFARALPIALVAAAACSLRQSNFPAAAGTVAFGFVARLLRSPKAERRRVFVEAGMVAGLTLVGLLPWMALSYVNAGTILYPLMKGTTNPAFGLVGKVPLDEEARWFLINLGYPGPVYTIALFVLAGFLIGRGRRNLSIHAQVLGSVFGYVLLLHFFQSWSDFVSVARYHFAFTISGVLAVALKAPEAEALQRVRMPKLINPATVVVVAVGLQAVHAWDMMGTFYSYWADVAQTAFHSPIPGKSKVKDEATLFYERLQAALPPGARMLIMLDHTYLADYKRNEVLNLDQPGALSPPPGMPFDQGANELADYLLSLDIRYVAFVINEASPEYRYSLWIARAGLPAPVNNRGGLLKSMAPWYLDTFDKLMSLTKSRKILFNEGTVWLLDLAAKGS
jgi:hypothetical protein